LTTPLLTLGYDLVTKSFKICRPEAIGTNMKLVTENALVIDFYAKWQVTE
jgi:hypothetical protein